MINKMFEQVEAMYDQMVEWRRHLHENPELSFQEFNTSKMIGDILEGYGIEVKRNVGGNGVVGKIYGSKPGKTIALRADFDALPIQDEKEVEYKSKVLGVMHACGHDGHTATLLAVAKVLNDNRDSLAGNIVLLHQHAEELPPGGAIAMIEDGCLEGVDVVYGAHLASRSPLGEILYGVGPTSAASDSFELKIQGKGGHGASPHQTVDAIAIGAQIANQLKHIVSRMVNPQKPAVLSIGSFHAGNAGNVIADTAELTGTVRTFDEDVRELIEKEMEELVSGVCTAFHATYTFKYSKGYPSTINTETETNILVETVKTTMPEAKLVEVLKPGMGGEDFAYYLQNRPGCFFSVGARNEEIDAVYPHHHPKFTFDEKAMLYTAKVFLSLVYQYTHSNRKEGLVESAM
ncbi:M20 family metallopeptidase [Niallia sp. 03133]|uniref:M20 family metallopeptidase n=1 Tax=Niallia sp. 03133 TaxID=3458060 RepID=UPI004044B396